MTLRRGRALFLALTLGFAAAFPATARDVEIRGTLLCRDQGDELRERPADLPCLIVRADEYPRAVELVETAAIFRLRLPSSAIDRPLVLRVYRGQDQLDAFRIHVDPSKLVHAGDVDVISVGARLLPVDCEKLACTIDVGLAAREEMLATAPPSSKLSTRKISAFLSPLLLLVPALSKGGSADKGKQVVPEGGRPVDPFSLLEPADFPSYARAAASPAIGRSLTSPRHPEELAIWNPSALARGSASGVAFGSGSMNSVRGSAWAAAPHAWREKAPWAPDIVTAAFLRYSANGDSPPDTTSDPTDYEESYLVGGLGFSLGERAAVSASVHSLRLRDEIERDAGRRVSQDFVDVDLAATWDPKAWLRLAAAGTSLRGEAPKDAFRGEHDSPRELILAAAAARGPVHGGIEVGIRENATDLSAGMSVKPFGPFLLDLGGTSRENAVQIGLETILGPAKIGFRVRLDDLEPMQHFIWASIAGDLAP